MTLSPELNLHVLYSRIPASLPMAGTTGLGRQLDSFQFWNCFGRGLSWAESGAALSSAKPQTKSDSRRIPCYRLDTNRLPLVPGLFNWSDCSGPARTAFAIRVQRHAVHALQIARHALVEPFRNPLAVFRLLQQFLVGRIAEERNFRKD